MKISFLSLTLFAVLFFETVFASDVSNVIPLPQKPLSQKYVGTYVNENNSVSLITEDNGILSLWILAGVVKTLVFEFDLNNQGVSEVWQDHRQGHQFTKISTTQYIENGVLYKLVISTNRLSMLTEEWQVKLNGQQLDYTRERRYFKRSFIIAGPWVHDVESAAGRTHNLSHHRILSKIDDRPISVIADTDADLLNPSEVSTDNVITVDFRKPSLCSKFL